MQRSRGQILLEKVNVFLGTSSKMTMLWLFSIWLVIETSAPLPLPIVHQRPCMQPPFRLGSCVLVRGRTGVCTVCSFWSQRDISSFKEQQKKQKTTTPTTAFLFSLVPWERLELNFNFSITVRHEVQTLTTSTCAEQKLCRVASWLRWLWNNVIGLLSVKMLKRVQQRSCQN